jgi:ABC-2 type transport system ATP-binding protein
VAGVRIQGVRKRFSRTGPWVLDGVDATLPAGAVTLLVGGNGSGKSTLLRVVAGASAPTRGRVVRPPGPVGYVPERLPADIRMTARQYVRHLARIQGTAFPDTLLDRLSLAPGPDVPVGELSRGNRQKVALAVALAGPTAVLVLDEPYGGLDGPAAQVLTGLVAAARGTGTAVLISGHDPAVFPAADAVLRIAGGRLTGAGEAMPTRLVLRRVDPSAVPLDGDWDAGRELLTVLTPDPDAVLRAALAGGWSFVEGLVRS